MKVSTSTTITDINGKEIREIDYSQLIEATVNLVNKIPEETRLYAEKEIKAIQDILDPKKVLTVGTVCVNAILGSYPEEKIDGMEKLTRFNLANKINKNKEADLTKEEVDKIKTLTAYSYSTLIVGRVYEILDAYLEKLNKKSEK